MRPSSIQQGHVLWLMVILLGSLAQLAILTIQQSAASGLAVRRIEAYWQRDMLAEHIAVFLQQLPLQTLSAPDQQALWHPLGAVLRSACAESSRQSWTHEACFAQPTAAGGWAWQLERDGEPVVTWPGLITQRYRLRVRARSASGLDSHWQFDYEQRSLP